MSLPNPIVLLDARARYVHPAFQMTRASTRTVFDATGKLVTVPVNALGWDRDPMWSASGLLVEPEVTNLCTSANDFTHADWVKLGLSVSANAAVAPDGTTTMDKLVEDTNNGSHRILMNIGGITAPDKTIAGSIYAKAGEKSRISVTIREETTSVMERLRVDVADGSIISSSSGLVDYGVIDVGGGIYKLYMVAQFDSEFTSSRFQVQFLDENDNEVGYQGDGTSGLYLWGAQYEVGDRVTTLIETNGSTAMRSPDQLTLPNITDAPWWNSREGTIIADFTQYKYIPNGNLWSLGNQTLRLDLRGSGYPEIITRGSVMSSGFVNSNIPDITGRHVVAVAWDGDDVAICGDGLPVKTTTQISAIGANNLFINRGGIGFFEYNQVHHRRLTYHSARLSNADLQSLTAIQE